MPARELHQEGHALCMADVSANQRTRLLDLTEDLARGAAQLALLTLKSETGPDYGAPAVLLCSLPQIGDTTSIVDTFSGAATKASDLLRCFHLAAEEVGVPLLDLSAVAYDDADGVHLNADGHRAVALAVAQAAREILG